MTRTLLSLWSIVTGLLLGSIGGSLWINGENTVLAVLLLIGMFVLLVAGLFGYSREEQRLSEDVTYPAWWIHKLLNTLVNAFFIFGLLYFWLRDLRIALIGAFAGVLANAVVLFVQRRKLAKAPPQP